MDGTRGTIRAVGVVLFATVALACGDAGDVRERSEGDEGAQRAALLDDEVVKEMASPDTVGRIIYEPPADLSLASAQLRRPDLVKPAASQSAGASRAGSPRDTTGGDAVTDTSGGAARRQPRPQRP